MTDSTKAIASLLSPYAVRMRAHEMLDVALAGGVEGWIVDLDRLPVAAELTATTTRDRYPDLNIPFHTRARHFVAGAPKLPGAKGSPERTRANFELTILSVLLDAGAGANWRYHDAATGKTFARSEGLAVASQRMFEAGALDNLLEIDARRLAHGFQVSEDNPLLGLEGRAALLRRLGAQIETRPERFVNGRLGGLYDSLVAVSGDNWIPAPGLLFALLTSLGPIWADRLVIDGVPLGDCWRHPAIRRDDASDGLVPLHKLSQWLAYSLIEPLQAAGFDVDEIGGLTGLAEYRNGGLFVDMGVLRLADPADAERTHNVSDPLIVAWRAMTVALLDRMHPLVCERLGVSEADFPLARMLEGGSWAAGRRVAAERRADGGPPFTIISDGTVF